MCEFGVSGGLFAKTDIVKHTGKLGSPLIKAGIDGILTINCQDDRAMSFTQLLGLATDNTLFRIDKGHSLAISSDCINIGSSVGIRSRWEKLRYNMGIGVLIRVDGNVSDRYHDYSGPSFSTPHINVDTVYDQLVKNTRNIIPYITLGITYQLNQHVSVQVSLEETLIDFYEPGSRITYYVNYVPQFISVDYQPLYIGARVSYYFLAALLFIAILRRFRVQEIMIFPFLHAKVVISVQPKATGISLA